MSGRRDVTARKRCESPNEIFDLTDTPSSADSEEPEALGKSSRQRGKLIRRGALHDVIDLTGPPGPSAISVCAKEDCNAIEQSCAQKRRVTGLSAAPMLPAWHNLQGSKRLQAELRYMHRQVAKGLSPQISNITTVGDDLSKWRFKVKSFDTDCQAGCDLNADLAQLAALYGQDHLLMEATFPSNYPEAPFFLRMVTPRCCWYTGHVTAGGSICIELLTQSGSRNGWSSGMCFESVMNTVLLNMLHCDVYWVQTATGPGGMAGPLRVDLKGSFSHAPMSEYSDREAKDAFRRMLFHHQRNGW